MDLPVLSISKIATSCTTRLRQKLSIVPMAIRTSKIHSSPNEPSLCRSCRQLDFTTRTDNENIIIPFSSAKRILKSAGKGCPLCVFLLALISRAGLETKFSGVRLRCSGSLLSGFSVLIDVPGDHSYSISIETYVTQDDVFPECLSEQNKGVFRRGDNPHTIGILNDWLAHCTRHHDHCSRNSSAKMPSRLLEITRSGTHLMARLINAQNRNDRYLTLSYCWGQTGKLPPGLLTSNIKDLYAGIAVSSLPMTFQDAVDVVLELQLSHIWIDSLCIIQDDEEDKQNEIGRMGEIFANSHLTIAATDGIDSFAGLFHTSRTIPKIRIGWNDAAKRDHWVHLRMNRYEYPIFASGLERLTHGCLEKRAWTFQERILSPRVVHFTSKQLKWECNCRNTYEFSEQPDFDPESELSFNMSFQIGQKTKLAQVLRSEASKHHVYEIWYRLLEEYSLLDMSFDGDKINAIKGIAEATSERLGDSLIHGIWQNDVRQGLLWSLRPNDDTLEMIRATNLPVPSWSWAKTHGRLGCINLPPGPNSLCPSSATIDSSQMEHGILILDALCQFAALDDGLYLSFGGTFRLHLHLDNAFDLVVKKSRRKELSDEQLHIHQDVYCIHIGTWLSAETGGGTFYGLAVQPTDIKEGVYKRIGMFSTTRLNLSEITSTWKRQKMFLV